MAPFTYSRSLIPLTAENVRDMQAMFAEIRDYISTPKITGVTSIAANSIGPGRVAPAAVGPSQLAVTAPGFADNTFAMQAVEATAGPLSGVGGAFGSGFGITGQQPGDLIFMHRAWKVISGSYSNLQIAMSYSDSAGSDEILPRTTLTASEGGWDGTGTFKSLGGFVGIATSATGGEANVSVFNLGGTQVALIRFTVILVRLS